jgi:hypothetical protein
MNKLIACCGLNCETCDAYIATSRNDDALRKATAEKWQQMFSPDITVESINCTGCRSAGAKFAHCNECEIRICVNKKGYDTCGDCADLETCQIVAMIHKHVPEALKNLKES